MKIYPLILVFFFLIFPFLSQGQYHRNDRGFLIGLNAGYIHPNDMGKILKNGIGGNFSIKYLINDVLGIGFESGYSNFKNKLNLDNTYTEQDYKCHLIPVLLEATFYFPTWNRTTLPYLGTQFGAYFTQIKITQKTESVSSYMLSKNLFLSSPGIGLHAGILFQLANKNWWMDIRLRTDYVPKVKDEYELDDYQKGNIGFDKMLNIGGNIGILYKF